MAILVTGGTGFIGSHTVVQLLNDGREVVILDNLCNSKECVLDRIKTITGKSVKFYKADLLNVEEIEKVFENGIVYVDGIALDEPYISSPTHLYEGTVFPLVVEDGHIFVLGDNRMNSKDSRSPEIGQIDCREVLGKAIFLIFPGADYNKQREFDRIGVLQ